MTNLDEIFRSIIYIKTEDGRETISQRDCIKNFKSMQQIVPEAPEEKAYHDLYIFILEYIKNCDSSDLSVPSYEYTRNHFETVEGSESVLSILDKIKGQQPYVGMDYKNVLKKYNEEQKLLELERILQNSSKIAFTGMVLKNGKRKIKLKGINDAVSYFARETKELHRQLTGIKTEGQIISEEDSREMKEEYQKTEADPTNSIGINTWLKEIDDTTKGIKAGELMMILAFVGHCKTTIATNFAYRAMYGGWNTAFISLEMTYEEIRRKMYILHSCNPQLRVKWPEYAHLVGTITYNNVLYGRLTSEEKEFYFKVCDDFNRNENELCDDYGRFFIWQPENTVTTLSDVDLRLRQYQQELQLTNRDLELVVIDYISLMGADVHERTRDHNETTNNIIKNLKRLCLTFNNGKGIRIISPHQANREGYREALKNEGIYYLTALSNTHEAERSCDIVMSSFKFDEGGDNNRLKLCNLKNRRNELFKPFDACIDFETGFIYNFKHSIENQDSMMIDISSVVG
jgi:hypothetical protein